MQLKILSLSYQLRSSDFDTSWVLFLFSFLFEGKCLWNDLVETKDDNPYSNRKFLILVKFLIHTL